MLKFKGAWRFSAPSAAPSSTVNQAYEIVLKIAMQGDRWSNIEGFKSYFANAAGIRDSTSSSESWAESDLDSFMSQAASNAPLFIEALFDSCVAFGQKGLGVPDLDMLNRMLVETGAGFVIDPPDVLRQVGGRPDEMPIPVDTRPPTLAEQAVETLQASLQRSEELLAQGHDREAVQSILWLLESVSTAFRGVNTESGVIGGTYFNTIVRELRTAAGRGTSLDRVLDWMTTMHGYLSAPAGGGVRHGIDLNRQVAISPSEARLYCNLARSYLGFLLAEHERLVSTGIGGH
jgi:hypothetical protein